jgi:hypothetical protein
MTATAELDPTKAHVREGLAEIIVAGGSPRWLMFSGHQPQPGGTIGKARLGQRWPGPARRVHGRRGRVCLSARSSWSGL